MTPDARDEALGLATRAALRVSIVVLAVAAATWLALQLSSLLLLVFVAVILAAGAFGPVGWLEGRGVPTVAGVVAVYVGVLALLLVAVLVVAPPVVDQLAQFVKALPQLATDLLDRYRPVLERFGLPTGDAGLASLAVEQLRNASGSLSGIPLAVVSVVTNIVTAVFLSILILLERDRARRWLFRFVAPDDRPTVESLATKAGTRLGAYLRGQLLIMTVTGVASAVGLTLLGVPFAVALGLLAFLTEAIPLAGPVIAGAVMIVVALLESPAQAAGTFLLVLAIQQLEGLVLVPQIQGRVISISPAVALVAVLAGSTLGGIPGALVAIPIVAIATVVLEEIVLPWRRREIGTADEAGSESESASAGEPAGDAAAPS